MSGIAGYFAHTKVGKTDEADRVSLYSSTLESLISAGGRDPVATTTGAAGRVVASGRNGSFQVAESTNWILALRGRPQLDATNSSPAVANAATVLERFEHDGPQWFKTSGDHLQSPSSDDRTHAHF